MVANSHSFMSFNLSYSYLDSILFLGVFSTVVKCKNSSSIGGAMVAIKVTELLYFDYSM